MEQNGPTPRVLIVAPLYHTDRGGLGRQAVLLTERLAELGAEPAVVTRRMRGLPERTFSARVPRVQVSAGRATVHNYERASLRNLVTSLRFSAGLLREMARQRGSYDLLHFHGASLPLLVALPWAKLLGKKVVAKVAAIHQGVEAGDLRRRHGPLGPVLAWVLGHVDAYVATTDEIGAALRDEGYPGDRIVRIPNFVDAGRFRPPTPEERGAARRDLGLEGHAVVLHSGRLSPRKNGNVLLEAFATALARAGEASPLLVFMGDGPERPALESFAQRLGCSEQVRFVGFQNDVTRYLHAADMLVIASRVEGLPNALLEGMAAGLPVVATRLGGSREVVLEGETGLLVPPGDAGALADSLVRLLLDSDLRTALGAAGARRIEQTFTLEQIAPHYVDLYGRLLADHAPKGASVFGQGEEQRTENREQGTGNE